MDTFDHQKIEKHWQEVWEKEGLYDTPNELSGRENYYFLTEFPYPSGNLHIGHWYAFAVPDIYARFMRMNGNNVLFPVGFDSFGLPAENAAIKRGLDPRAWTYDNIAFMRGQLKSMGNSFDWSREIKTSDPEFYRWTQWLFIQFYKNGLVERKRAAVNWCSGCQTVLANEQVVKSEKRKEGQKDGGEQGPVIEVDVCERCGTEVVQKELLQWFFKITQYADRLVDDLDLLDWREEVKQAQINWIGRSEGALLSFAVQFGDSASGSSSSAGSVGHEIRVFTTRPDTLYGATYVVLAPEHAHLAQWQPYIKNWDAVEEYRAATTRKTEIERTFLGLEKTGVRLEGVHALNPATGEPLPVWVADYVLVQYGTGAVMAVPAHDQRDFAFAQAHDLPIKQVVRMPDGAGNDGALPILGDGELVNSHEFTGMHTTDAKHKITDHVGGSRTKTYRLHDWLLSRQRYWGTPIPIVYDPDGEPHPVPDEHLPWRLPEDVTDFLPKGTSPVGTSNELRERTERIFGKGWTPEVDTMDTFVDSSWYFLRYLDPKNESEFVSKEAQKRWMPVDRYSGGAEHTTMHVLYSRFFYKAMHDLGLVTARKAGDQRSSVADLPTTNHQLPTVPEPYTIRMNRGLILGPDGQKMSKSKGNVVDPDEYVRRVGADTVKMYLAFVGPYNVPGQYPWDLGGIAGIRRFLERVWRLRRVVTDAEVRSPQSDAMRRLVGRTIQKTTTDIAAFKFNTAISALMVLTNTLEKEDTVNRKIYETLLKLLGPFAPHCAEELWHRIGNKDSIHREPWPAFDADAVQREPKTIVVQINGKVRGQFIIDEAVHEKEAIERAQALPGVVERLREKTLRRTVYVPMRLVNFVTE